MQKAAYIIFGALTIAQSAGAECHKCEVIRERNRNTPPPKEEYYEDYLKARQDEGEEVQGKIEFIDRQEQADDQ